jgi:hypothetical protein
MDVGEAFSWPGGGELIVELSVEKGRPAALSEVVEALERFRWTASVAEAIASYGAWTVERNSKVQRFAEFDAWLSQLPDPQALPATWSDLDALLNPTVQDPFAPYFDAAAIHRVLVKLVGLPTQSGAGLPGSMNDPALWLQLLAAAYENPTRSWIRVTGPLLALGVAAGIWGAVAYAKETKAHDCREQARSIYDRQLDLIKQQARLQGNMSGLDQPLRDVTKATFAASTACTLELPNIRFVVGGVEVSLSRPERQNALDTSEGPSAKEDIHLNVTEVPQKHSGRNK